MSMNWVIRHKTVCGMDAAILLTCAHVVDHCH